MPLIETVLKSATCDCGQKKFLEETEVVLLGIEKKVYCAGVCADKVTRFLDERDRIHDAVVAKWDNDMKTLYKKYPDFAMPDKWMPED